MHYFSQQLLLIQLILCKYLMGLMTLTSNFLFRIYRNCEKLDIFVFKTPINQRPMAKMRVDQLKYDSKHIQVNKDLIHFYL